MNHKVKAQLRFNDIDILGHLNNTVYFSLYDLGKALYMEEAGLKERGGAVPRSVIVDIHCTYFKPIHFGDEIYVETHCSDIGDKSFTLDQQLVDDKGEVRSKCRTVMVSIDPKAGTSVHVPEDFRRKIEEYENR